MLNENVIKALSTALLTHRNANDQLSNWPEANRLPFEQAEALVNAFKTGDSIAIIWTVDDVFRVMFPDDDEEENTKHRTPDEIDMARRVLKAADDDHDASVGINWESLQYYLDKEQE